MGTQTSQTLIGSPVSVSDAISYKQTMPPGFGQFVTYGKNANGETIFKYVNPNDPGPGKWEITPDYRTIEVPNLNPDGSVVTKKQYYEQNFAFTISPDGRSLVNNLPPGVRTVEGYGNDAKFVISGSGLENKITSSYSNVFGAGQYSAILLNVGDVTDPYKQMEYLDKMAKYAAGGYQKIQTTVKNTTLFDDLASQAQQLIKDLGPIAPIALAVLAPGVGAAIGSALGIGSATAAAVVGNTLIQTVLNGGDVGKALTSSLAGAATAGIAGFAKDYVSGGEFGSALATNSALASKVIGDVTYAALTGQDPGKALAASSLGAAIDIGASKIDGFSGLKPEVQSAIKVSISGALQGKDINLEGVISGAAKVGLASYAASQMPGYDSLDTKYKQLAVNAVAGYLQGKTLTQTAMDWAITEGRRDITVAVNEDKAISEGWTGLAQKNAAAAAGYTDPEKYDTYLTDKKAAERAEVTSRRQKAMDEEAAVNEGWDNLDEKKAAATAGYTDPEKYDTYLTDRKANEDAVREGWDNVAQKSEAKAAGYTDPAKYDDYLTDKTANEQAIAGGWTGSTQKAEAATAGYTDPTKYDTYLADKTANETAKTEGWTGSAQKAEAAAAGYTNPEKYDTYLTDKTANEAAVSEGWTSSKQKAEAAAAGYTNPTVYDNYLTDKQANTDAIAQGWTGSDQKAEAATFGYTDPTEYTNYLSGLNTNANTGGTDTTTTKPAEDDRLSQAVEKGKSGDLLGQINIQREIVGLPKFDSIEDYEAYEEAEQAKRVAEFGKDLTGGGNQDLGNVNTKTDFYDENSTGMGAYKYDPTSGTYTYTSDDGSTLTLDGDGNIVGFTETTDTSWTGLTDTATGKLKLPGLPGGKLPDVKPPAKKTTTTTTTTTGTGNTAVTTGGNTTITTGGNTVIVTGNDTTVANPDRLSALMAYLAGSGGQQAPYTPAQIPVADIKSYYNTIRGIAGENLLPESKEEKDKSSIDGLFAEGGTVNKSYDDVIRGIAGERLLDPPEEKKKKSSVEEMFFEGGTVDDLLRILRG